MQGVARFQACPSPCAGNLPIVILHHGAPAYKLWWWVRRLQGAAASHSAKASHCSSTIPRTSPRTAQRPRIQNSTRRMLLEVPYLFKTRLYSSDWWSGCIAGGGGRVPLLMMRPWPSPQHHGYWKGEQRGGGSFGKFLERPQLLWKAGNSVGGSLRAAEHRRPLRTTSLAAESSTPRAFQGHFPRWRGYHGLSMPPQLDLTANFDVVGMLRAARR